MATSTSAPGKSSNRALAIVLAILGVLAIILGVLFVAGALNSVHSLVGSHHKGHHEVRAAISVVVGVVLLILAWAANRSRS